jgi:hypothetical protein
VTEHAALPQSQFALPLLIHRVRFAHILLPLLEAPRFDSRIDCFLAECAENWLCV